MIDEEISAIYNWASKNGLCDGRTVQIEDFSKFSNEVAKKIVFLLSSQILSDAEVYSLSATLA